MNSEDRAPRLPLLKALKDLAKSGATLDASIVTTYAFNGLFYEEVLLRSFRRAGSRLNIVLADAGQLSEGISDPLRRPTRAGIDYLLAPIPHLGAFHPKLVALLSERQPILALGSHNVTDAGFSHNEEITAFWDTTDPVSPGILQGAVEYALQWLSSAGALPDEVLTEIVRRLRGLLPKPTAENGEVGLLVSTAAAPLWSQLISKVVGRVDRVTMFGPYFDAHMDFLKAIERDLAPSEIIVAVQPTTTVLPSPDLSPPMTRFVDASALQAFWPNASEVGFAHGKALAIEGVGGVVVSVGSANPTAAAWLARPCWNAEANLCLTGKAAATAFSALGLDRLANAPSIEANELAEIAVRSQELRSQERATVDTALPPVVAGRLLDGGIFLSDYEPPQQQHWALAIAGGPAYPAILKTIEGGSLVQLGDQRIQAGLHELRSDSEVIAFVLLNDSHALKAATTSRDGARILDHLGSLEDGAGLTSLLDLLDRHILSSDTAAGSSRTADAPKPAESTTEGNAPFGPRGVTMPAGTENALRRPRLNDGLIAEIIAALIRALGAPRSASPTDGDAPNLDAGDAGDGLSSDDLANNLEAGADASEIDWPRLVTACRKRLGTMLKRLKERLDEAAAANYPPSWTLGRLVVVLSLLSQLRAHPPQTSSAISGRVHPSSLVSKDHLRTAFSLAVRALYGEGKLAIHLEVEPSTRAAEERRLIDNLLLWFAREIGAEYRRQQGETGDIEEIQARADLGLIVMSAAAYEKLEGWAAARDPWLAVWDDASVVADDWTERHLAYGSALQRLRGRPRVATTRLPVIGDLVRWDGEPDLPWVISSVGDHKVSLVEPAGLMGERTKVLSSSVSLLDLSEHLAEA